MELSEQQRQSVKEWLATGASLSDVQKNLKNEFNITLTYMDVRLLVLDVGAAVQDKPEHAREALTVVKFTFGRYGHLVALARTQRWRAAEPRAQPKWVRSWR